MNFVINFIKFRITNVGASPTIRFCLCKVLVSRKNAMLRDAGIDQQLAFCKKAKKY